MEKWCVVNHGVIPKAEYYTQLEYGEEKGLLVTLKNDDYLVTLDFGAVNSIHCFDEGRVSSLPYEKNTRAIYHEKHYEDIIYRIENSAYQNFMLEMTKTLYTREELHHYLVVTLDYFIDVITLWDIDVCVENLKTHKKTYAKLE